MQNVAKNENLVLPSLLAERIAEQCEGNMRKALLMLYD
jgi:hypothetical protein